MRQNACNRRKRIGSYTSAYKGVSLNKSNGRWRAVIDGKHLGYFSTETQAAGVYNLAAIFRHGEFAVLNEIGG